MNISSNQTENPICGALPVALDLPNELQFLARIRSDLQHLNTDSLIDRIIIRNWWESAGHSEYPNVEWPLTGSDITTLGDFPANDPLGEGGHGLSLAFKGHGVNSLLEHVSSLAKYLQEFVIGPEAVENELPDHLMFLWRDRKDLQPFHDIKTSAGRLKFLHWWLSYGQHEYTRLRWSMHPSWLDLVKTQNGVDFQLPKFLSLIIRTRDDLHSNFHLHTEAGWLAALHWWEQSGFSEYGVPSWSLKWHTPLRRIIFTRSAAFDSNEEPVESRPAQALAYLPFMARAMRPDLVSAFDTRTRTGCIKYRAWWNFFGKSEYEIFNRLLKNPDSETPELNIIGYAKSVIGIAEDVRMAAKASEIAKIPFCVIDAPMPGPAKLDNSLEAQLVDAPVHPVSLYCLPPTELLRLGMASTKPILHGGTYNIGGWHWELPSWPVSLSGVNDLVDEIWVYTDFVRQAFAPHTGKPVLKMPLAVELPAHGGRNRAVLHLPKERFLFLLMFDGNSWLSRKNPIAAVRAFFKAFSGNNHVGLVIKTISLNKDSEGWREVEAEIAGDTRVSVIDQTLDRSSLTQLMASCDAYVSLHRSEGFGRIIAEAMLLGIPTVTTNFSGNTEFCTAETSFLVNGPLIALKKDDYLFAEGQHWCDPDVDEAAHQMRRVFEDRAHASHLAAAARQNIQTNFSARAAGEAYRNRLRELRANGRI